MHGNGGSGSKIITGINRVHIINRLAGIVCQIRIYTTSTPISKRQLYALFIVGLWIACTRPASKPSFCFKKGTSAAVKFLLDRNSLEIFTTFEKGT